MTLKYKIFFIVSLFSFSLINTIFCQESINIIKGDEVFDISSKLMILEDPQKQMKIDDVVKAKNENRFSPGPLGSSAGEQLSDTPGQKRSYNTGETA